MILLSILILTFPTDWELFKERKGEDPKKKGQSMTVRGLLMIVCSVVSVILMHIHFSITDGVVDIGLHIHTLFSGLLLMFIKCLFLSFAIFFGFFDYAINLILGRKPWYSYLSKSPIDKVWSKVNWRWRMAIRGVVFLVALVFYFK